ncbi:MAG: hypothetical protein ACRDNX_11920, partial [Gaiellaceae bacterium]
VSCYPDASNPPGEGISRAWPKSPRPPPRWFRRDRRSLCTARGNAESLRAEYAAFVTDLRVAAGRLRRE